MKTTFRSKYSWWMTAIIALAAGITPCMMFIDGFSWFIAAVSVIIGVFFIDIMINTSYTIKDGKLILKAGILFRSTLDISKIISIKSIHTIINENHMRGAPTGC